MRETAKRAQITFSAPKYQKVTAIIDSPGVSVDSSSYGGWDTIPRPQSTSLLRWLGKSPMLLTVPVLFDHFHSGHSTETAILNLERMAGRGAGLKANQEPPEVTLSTAEGFKSLVPHIKTYKWVISSIEWGDSIRRKTDGHRIRQAAVVTLMQKIEADAKIKSAPQRAGNTRRNTTHVVKKGETLMKISILEYGTADRWQDIAKANKIHDPRHLKPGTKLKLPK